MPNHQKLLFYLQLLLSDLHRVFCPESDRLLHLALDVGFDELGFGNVLKLGYFDQPIKNLRLFQMVRV